MDENKKEESEPDAAARPGAVAAPRGPRARRRLVIALTAAIAVLVVAAVALWSGDGGRLSPQAATPSPSAHPTPGADPGAAPTDGSEVPDPEEDGAEASGPGAPAPPSEASPFDDGELPPSASASGELVDGYPEPIMTPMSTSDVLDSSIATEGDVAQVTLVARTTATPDEIREHYRALWGDSGLKPSGAQGSGTAFADTSTSLTLAFTPESGTGTVYVLYGVFRSH